MKQKPVHFLQASIIVAFSLSLAVAQIFDRLPLSPVIGFSVLLILTGLAWLGLFKGIDILERLTLALGLSLSLGILITTLAVFNQHISLQNSYWLLIALCVLGGSAQLWQLITKN